LIGENPAQLCMAVTSVFFAVTKGHHLRGANRNQAINSAINTTWHLALGAGFSNSKVTFRWSQSVEDFCVIPYFKMVLGHEGNAMKLAKLSMLRTIALTLMLPGLAGLIVSAMFSVHYLDTMPRWPSPQQLRVIPRNIDGVVVYQTADEDRKLDNMEYTSVGVFMVGLVLGLVYLEKWGATQSGRVEEDENLTGDYS
jgi:hypothetical protein